MNKIKILIKKYMKKITFIIVKPISKVLNIFMNKNQVVFISFGGKQYSDNPRAISEKLHELSPTTRIVWLFKEPKKFKSVVPHYVKIIKKSKFSQFFYLATSKVWVDNDELVYNKIIEKSKDQLFIETWHGDRGLKKCFYDTKNFNPEVKFSLEYDNYCDYFITGSKFSEKIFPKMFNYNGTFLKSGYPRNDILFSKNENLKNKIKKELGIKFDEKVLLYAPTFKKSENINEEKINLKSIISVLEEKTKDKWVVVTRMHHIMLKEIEVPENIKVIDGTNYFDMSNLLFISDMLITDYSSCAGDIILMDKPVFLYISDYDYYKNEDRGVYFEMEESPFKFAKTNAELLNLIKEHDEDSTIKNCQEIKDFYGCYEDGHASLKVCDIILERLHAK